ncbi:uncharacterized protein V1516DRAFT_675715 [Lipomyces oligophaga]|uniref:uncharacterized protein n=1 Tax=Lipomyces oligophaga TaxID=45792 RepID=UPI0034CE47A2
MSGIISRSFTVGLHRSSLAVKNCYLNRGLPCGVIQRCGLATISQSILDSMCRDKVIPDIIEKFVPTTLLSVDFSNGDHAALGNTMKYGELDQVPRFSITRIDEPDSTTPFTPTFRYSIVILDVDPPFGDARLDPSSSLNTPGSGSERILRFESSKVRNLRALMVVTGVRLPANLTEAAEVTIRDGKASNGVVLVPYEAPFVDALDKHRKRRILFLLYREENKATGMRLHISAARQREVTTIKGGQDLLKLYGSALVGANFVIFDQKGKHSVNLGDLDERHIEWKADKVRK